MPFQFNLGGGAGGLVVFVILLNVIVGAFTAKVASEKGHDGAGWFFLGLVLGLVAFAIICIAPDESVDYDYEPDDKLALSLENIEKKLEKIESELAEKR